MKKALALLFVFVFLFSLTACSSQQEPAFDTAQKEPDTIASPDDSGTGEADGTEADPISSNTFDWEKEQQEDPIFTWVDPYPGEEWNEINGLSEEESFALMLQRSALSLANRNYKAYYYFLSGRSECDATRGEKNAEYVSPMVYLGSAAYPDDIIKCLNYHYLVTFHVTGITETSEKRSDDPAVVEKDLVAGEPEEIVWTHILCEIDDCLMGEWPENSVFALSTSLLTQEFIDELTTSGKTFMAYIDPVCTDYVTGEQLVLTLADGEAPEFCLSADSCFSLADGKLISYSSVADILAFDGKTPDDFISHVEMLREKYGVEMLEKLMPGDIHLTTA